MAALILIFFLKVISIALSDPSDDKLRQYIGLLGSLKFGDKCSYKNSAILRNFVAKDKSRFNFSDNSETLVDWVVDGDRKFCDATELLICGKEEGRCICGEASNEVWIGLKKVRRIH